MAEKRADINLAEPPLEQSVPTHPLLSQQVVVPAVQNQNVQPTQGQATQPMILAPQQPIIYQIRSRTKIYRNYNSKRSKNLGIAQLVLAGVAFIANLIGLIIATSTHRYHDLDLPLFNSSEHVSGGYYWEPNSAYFAGTGFWCIILIALSGSFAICAAKKRSRCMIVTHLVLAILASVFSFIMLAIASWAVASDAMVMRSGFYFTVHHWFSYDYENGWDTEHYADWAAGACKGSLFVSVCFLVTSLVAFITCVSSSTLCCNVLCSSETTTSTNEPNVQYSPNQYGGQVIILDSRGQPLPLMMLPSGMMTSPSFVPQAVPTVGTMPSIQNMAGQNTPSQSSGDVCQTPQPPPYSEK